MSAYNADSAYKPTNDFLIQWNHYQEIMASYWRPMPKHCILADSRGRDLQHEISLINTTHEKFHIKVTGGAKIRELIVAAERHLCDYPRDCIYIFGGQCDVTTRHRHTKEIYCTWQNSTDLTSELIAFTEVGVDWLNHLHPEAKVAICPLTGCDATKKVVNFQAGMQPMIDNAIIEYNSIVLDININSAVATPWTHNHYFKTNHGKLKIQHDLLASDGIHPSSKLVKLWAHDFINCFPKNPLMLTHNSIY